MAIFYATFLLTRLSMKIKLLYSTVNTSEENVLRWSGVSPVHPIFYNTINSYSFILRPGYMRIYWSQKRGAVETEIEN